MNKEDLKKYLNQELSNKEQNAFEQKMSDNLFLDEATEGLQEWKDASKKTVEELETSLNNQIDAVANSKSNEIKKVVRMPIFRIIGIAAGIIGILFFTLTYLHNQRMSSDNLYEDYFKVLTHPDGTVRGEDSAVEQSNTEKAIVYYEQENYKKAIYHYKEAVAENPSNDKNQLFLGISYLANYEPEEAIKTFTTYDFSNSKYIYDRDWYLALAYLKTKDLQNSKILFERLSKEDSYYQNSSKDILKSLGNKVL